jgi:hypothetical protein
MQKTFYGRIVGIVVHYYSTNGVLYTQLKKKKETVTRNKTQKEKCKMCN